MYYEVEIFHFTFSSNIVHVFSIVVKYPHGISKQNKKSVLACLPVEKF